MYRSNKCISLWTFMVNIHIYLQITASKWQVLKVRMPVFMPFYELKLKTSNFKVLAFLKSWWEWQSYLPHSRPLEHRHFTSQTGQLCQTFWARVYVPYVTLWISENISMEKRKIKVAMKDKKTIIQTYLIKYFKIHKLYSNSFVVMLNFQNPQLNMQNTLKKFSATSVSNCSK